MGGRYLYYAVLQYSNQVTFDEANELCGSKTKGTNIIVEMIKNNQLDMAVNGEEMNKGTNIIVENEDIREWIYGLRFGEHWIGARMVSYH